ncbi:MAG: exonuclease SbcCD subunit D [Lachnospiraceae bacterium]|nr:exonuclease SbcCD subunit D [Lachnospiraceae bacterium]
MKFIHTADIHWGMVPDSDRPWGKKREQAIRLTFQAIVEEAREIRADLLLISGDLFHRQPLARDLKEVNYLFSTIPGTRVVIIAGNHDRVRRSSALLSFNWCSNVTYLMDEDLSSVYFEDLNTEIYGFSYHTPEILEDKTAQFVIPNNRRHKILMLHGGDAKHLPFDKAAVAAMPFSYIALGHIHKPAVLIENRMAYPGSPEPLDLTETGAHGYYVGEIDDISGHVTSLEFKAISQAQYVPLVVSVTPATTNLELSQLIADEIRKRGAANIYRFRIRGMRDPDIHFDLDFLAGQWNIVEILDESEPQYDFHALFAEHPSDMIGFYIHALLKDEMSPVEKKALHYGIHALLMTKDERS